MKPAEARKLREAVRFNCRLSASDTWTLKVLINSMTTDTDPRLEVVERIRDANRRTAETPLRKDNWYSLSVHKELNRIESEIKQEAGDENNSNGE
jgi:hypothetical protein